MITLLKYFTLAIGSGTPFNTEWIRVPEGFQNWQLTVLVHGAISTTNATLQLQTSWDTSFEDSIGSPQGLAIPGPFPQDITAGMGPLVRINFTATADSVVTLSVYLTPKSE